MEILKIKDLSFTYPLCTAPAISGIDLCVRSGEFLAVCGATGCGKSTLLRLLKPEISAQGDRKGGIYFETLPISELPRKRSAAEIGYVMQRPEHQMVTDRVWHELAFGLENLGTERKVIARRVAETAAYFGIEDWYEKKVSELSGGQKQLVNLAAVMAMDPKVLILDEPTAQLDPIAASDFIATVKKINRELAVTVIIAEHRLEELLPVCDRLLVMENGRIADLDRPEMVLSRIKEHPSAAGLMPSAARLYLALGGKGECPVGIRQGKDFVRGYSNEIRELKKTLHIRSECAALEFKNVFFRYERQQPDVLNGLELTVGENEVYALLGGNGSGKTTALSSAAGLLRPYSGKIRVFGRDIAAYKNRSLYRDCLAMLPQDVQTVFLKNTVREELADAGTEAALLPFDVEPLLDRHPYDLSGGQQQLVALAKVLAARPRLLLLDEPTKGIDSTAKRCLAEVIRSLKSRGMTLLMVTHDVEFAAECADRCGLFFKGRVVSEDTADRFFSGNRFYTTAINRITRGHYDNVVTVEDAAELCRLNGEACM